MTRKKSSHTVSSNGDAAIFTILMALSNYLFSSLEIWNMPRDRAMAEPIGLFYPGFLFLICWTNSK
ncbi:MAG: hypothetical protein ACTSWN_17190 [Promethearchaeota archaeon]